MKTGLDVAGLALLPLAVAGLAALSAVTGAGAGGDAALQAADAAVQRRGNDTRAAPSTLDDCTAQRASPRAGGARAMRGGPDDVAPSQRPLWLQHAHAQTERCLREQRRVAVAQR